MLGIIKIPIVLFRIFLAYLEALYRFLVANKRKNIHGKIVLVTGAGRGIGKSLAKQFSDLGAKLVLWDINEKEVQQTTDEVKARGGAAYAYKCDVTNSDDVSDVAARVRSDVGDVYMVVNNAGIMLVKNTLSLTPKEVKRVFEVNVISHFYINNEFLPSMLQQNDGHIVTISSMAGKVGSSLLTDYCASKFAAFGYTESLAEEIRKHFKKTGVHTTTVCPMFANTALVTQHDRRIDYKPGPEGIMEPYDVAEMVVDGVLRNKREIYIPPRYGKVDFSKAILPLKVRQYMADVLGTGFYEKNKSD